jgi:hypothetical protein
MSREQKSILLVALAVFVIFAISNIEKIGTFGGIYSPKPGHSTVSWPVLDVVLSLDHSTLLIEWASPAAVFGAALWVSCTVKKNK